MNDKVNSGESLDGWSDSRNGMGDGVDSGFERGARLSRDSRQLVRELLEDVGDVALCIFNAEMISETDFSEEKLFEPSPVEPPASCLASKKIAGDALYFSINGNFYSSSLDHTVRGQDLIWRGVAKETELIPAARRFFFNQILREKLALLNATNEQSFSGDLYFSLLGAASRLVIGPLCAMKTRLAWKLRSWMCVGGSPDLVQRACGVSGVDKLEWLRSVDPKRLEVAFDYQLDGASRWLVSLDGRVRARVLFDLKGAYMGRVAVGNRSLVPEWVGASDVILRLLRFIEAGRLCKDRAYRGVPRSSSIDLVRPSDGGSHIRHTALEARLQFALLQNLLLAHCSSSISVGAWSTAVVPHVCEADTGSSDIVVSRTPFFDTTLMTCPDSSLSNF